MLRTRAQAHVQCHLKRKVRNGWLAAIPFGYAGASHFRAVMFEWLSKQGVRSSEGFEFQFTGRFTAEYREGDRVMELEVEGSPIVAIKGHFVGRMGQSSDRKPLNVSGKTSRPRLSSWACGCGNPNRHSGTGSKRRQWVRTGHSG